MAYVDIPPGGLLDLHCHILPGIDDGCRNLVDSLEVVRQLSEAGFRGAVCTPHVCTTWFPENQPAKIAAWAAALQLEIDSANLQYQLWPGGEVRLAENTITWFGEFGVPTIGPGRAVLIDWWGRDWPVCCDNAIDWLLASGYQPVLAHPERMGLEEAELNAVIADLEGRGVLLQGNLNSLAGGEGRDAQRRADHWLASGKYYLLASDTHGPESVAGRVAGLKRVLEHYGDKSAQTLLVERPRRVMNWGLVAHPEKP